MVKRFFINFGIFWTIFGFFKIWDVLFGSAAATSIWFIQTIPLAIMVALFCMLLEKYLT